MLIPKTEPRNKWNITRRLTRWGCMKPYGVMCKGSHRSRNIAKSPCKTSFEMSAKCRPLCSELNVNMAILIQFEARFVKNRNPWIDAFYEQWIYRRVTFRWCKLMESLHAKAKRYLFSITNDMTTKDVMQHRQQLFAYIRARKWRICKYMHVVIIQHMVARDANVGCKLIENKQLLTMLHRLQARGLPYP